MSQNLTFPILHDDVVMRQKVAHKPEIRFMDQENGTVICSYIVSCDGTFDEMYSREARGIVFDKNGKVISRPLHKFSNLNQNPEVLYEKIDWSKVTRVMDKRDGSMIHTVAVKNPILPAHYNFDLKSKKSYTSDVANQAKSFMMRTELDGHHYVDFCNWCVVNDVTAIFEWTSPIARIVCSYSQDELRLLHIRNNVDGIYMTRDEVHALADRFNIPGVADASIESIDSAVFDDVIHAIKANKVQELIDNTVGVEGWVIQFESGDMLKIKTKWYMDLHHHVTFLRERDIAELVLDEKIDDLKSIFVNQNFNLDLINEIEQRVINDVNVLIKEINSIKIEGDRRDFAIKYKSHNLFGLLMQKFSGKEPNYNIFFKKFYLKDRYNLSQINLLDVES
jgi:RNA ligase